MSDQQKINYKKKYEELNQFENIETIFENIETIIVVLTIIILAGAFIYSQIRVEQLTQLGLNNSIQCLGNMITLANNELFALEMVSACKNLSNLSDAQIYNQYFKMYQNDTTK